MSERTRGIVIAVMVVIGLIMLVMAIMQMQLVPFLILMGGISMLLLAVRVSAGA